MKVRKTQKGSEWFPSENKGLKVGETIDITDPRELIVKGWAVAVGDDGQDLDAFDLYGVVDPDLVEELKAFKEAQHAKQVKANLEREHKELEKELAELKKKNAKKYKLAELEAMDWQDLRKEATDLGVMKPGMDRKTLTAAMVAVIENE